MIGEKKGRGCGGCVGSSGLRMESCSSLRLWAAEDKCPIQIKNNLVSSQGLGLVESVIPHLCCWHR